MTLQQQCFRHARRKTPWNRSLSTNTKRPHPKTQEYKHQILSASLPHVHSHGWTTRAIAQGILSIHLPPSYMGHVSDERELIHFFMNDCNARFSNHLETIHPSSVRRTEVEFVEDAIRTRLEMVRPYIRSQRWAEGMALGASPFQVQETTQHLKDIVSIIEENVKRRFGHSTSMSLLDRGGLGTVYVATELHMLADSSPEYHDTWTFLKERMVDWEQMRTSEVAASTSTISAPLGVPTSDRLVAAQAVALSLGGAVLSLMAPAAKSSMNTIAGAVVPKVMDWMQNGSEIANNQARSTTARTSTSSVRRGTRPEDYDLPSFDGEEAIELNGK